MNALHVVAGVLNGTLEKAQTVLDAWAANRYEAVELPDVDGPSGLL